MNGEFKFKVLKAIYSIETETGDLLLGPDDLKESLNRLVEDIDKAMCTLVSEGYIKEASIRPDSLLHTTGCTQKGLSYIRTNS